jgi:tetratricopeptide (TPR) repeat protein
MTREEIMKKITIILAILTLSFLFIVACSKIVIPEQPSQVEWTKDGWDHWKLGEYEDAEVSFNNALDIDSTYSDAYNGLGWTYIRMQKFTSSIDNFNTVKMLESGTQVAYEAFTGAAISFFMTDDFTNSIASAKMVTNMDPDNELYPFVFYRDGSISLFDVWLLLALDYFNTVDMANCIDAINNMRTIVGETSDFTSDNWDDINKEIVRLEAKDPTP